MCNQGLALWQKRGRAYFGEVKTDQTDYYLGDTISLDPFKAIYSDKRQCVNIQLYNQPRQKLLGDEGSTIQLEVDDEPGKSSEYTLPVPIKKIDDLTDFTKLNQEGKYQVTIPSGVDGQQVGITDFAQVGDINMYVHEIGNNTYEYFLRRENGTTFTDLTAAWQRLDFNAPVNLGGVLVNIFKVTVPEGANSCQALPGTDKKPCEKYTFTVRERTASLPRITDQIWKVRVELRHAPGEENEGSCYDSRKEDLIKYQSVDQYKELKINVHPYEKPQCIMDENVCKSQCQYYAGGSQANAKALCGKSGLYCCERNLETIKNEIQK